GGPPARRLEVRARTTCPTAPAAAAQAEKDAADANKFAESAEGHAKSAEAAAKNANTYAREADEAAKKAEEYQREQERKAREAAAKAAANKGETRKLTQDEIDALELEGISPEEYEKALELNGKDLADFLIENGGQIIVDLLFEDIKKCFTEGNFESCFWAVVGALPWGKALQVIKATPAITKALVKIVGGLDDFLDNSAKAKKLLARSEEILQEIAEACKVGAKPKNSFAPGTPVLMADGTRKPIEDVRVGERVMATDPETGRTEGHAVSHLIVGEGQKHLRELTVDTDGAAGDATGTLTATDEHPFWVTNLRAWVDAEDLTTGDLLRSPGGDHMELLGIRAWTEPMRVHNLTVDDLHTYYVGVGAESVLVHNAKKRICGPADVPNIVHDGVDDIVNNGRPQRLDENGDPDFFTVRPTTPNAIARKWGGAKIYDIPGGGNSYRILINKYGDVGWVVNHNYNNIMPYFPRQ
ncbi:polymorphic toxin-type HINT domain-containing protein, partial [Streptomyces lavendulocolor]|uniref:polymorphic toxin-type HINT domain-containing protein n=1 Tax=Streptomyces lavendulocolor TaxID=67316 RepID=UPI0033EFD840